MKLSELLRDVPVREVRGDANAEITLVTPDSRLVREGALFVAIPGTAKDGTAFIPQAVERGAAAIVAPGGAAAASAADFGARSGPRSTVLVDDPRAALALIAANFYGRPAEQLSLVGVTGTSGKTTTTRM
ncbi:MAG TPA: Mur ligase domain-containing protein, partial [Thermoanaerobaculia bacterium]|nr:Mur ligase domain-containing protein [Thermoanaerobaculia bacterium]